MIAWLGGFVIGAACGFGFAVWTLTAYLKWDREQLDAERARWPDEL